MAITTDVAVVQQLTHRSQDTMRLSITCTDANAQPLDLTDYEFQFVITDSESNNKARQSLTSGVPDNSISVVDNVITIAGLISLTPDIYYYEFKATLPNADVITWIRGDFILT